MTRFHPDVGWEKGGPMRKLVGHEKATPSSTLSPCKTEKMATNEQCECTLTNVF